MKYILFILLLKTAACAQAGKLKINDLGFLYPLKLSKANYIRLVDIVPDQYLTNLSDKLKYGIDRTYLVGVKLAVCFKELYQSECLHQIRLVFQGTFPHYQNPASTISLNDDALHVFFNLSKRELNTLIYRLKRKNSKNTSWIHGAVKNDQNAIRFNRQLKKLLATKKPYLITAMEGDTISVWNFFKVYPELTPVNQLNIFTVTGFQVSSQSLTHADCVTLSSISCEPTINQTIWKMRKISSAKRTHVDAIDCGSCHAVDALKGKLKFSRKDYTPYLIGARQIEYFQKSIMNNKAPRSQSNVRQLGYFGTKVSVSDRTISELKEQIDFYHHKKY
jgi:hypothetical protein